MTTRKVNNIRKNYGRLSNHERLQLAANAIIRDDDDEYHAVVNSTPRKSYHMRDTWMVDRHEALWRISTIYWLVTEEALREKAERRQLELILKLDDGGILSLDNNDPKKEKRIRVLEILDLEMREYGNLIWAYSEAIKRLSEAVKLKPEELLAYAHEKVKQRLEWPRYDYDCVVDEENLQKVTDKFYGEFAGYWPDL